jgi:mandelate racemase
VNLHSAAAAVSSIQHRNGTAVFEKLTFKSVEVRAVCVPLRRPVVSKVGLFNDWQLILIDLQTEEGVVGAAILSPI